MKKTTSPSEHSLFFCAQNVLLERINSQLTKYQNFFEKDVLSDCSFARFIQQGCADRKKICQERQRQIFLIFKRVIVFPSPIFASCSWNVLRTLEYFPVKEIEKLFCVRKFFDGKFWASWLGKWHFAALLEAVERLFLTWKKLFWFLSEGKMVWKGYIVLIWERANALKNGCFTSV